MTSSERLPGRDSRSHRAGQAQWRVVGLETIAEEESSDCEWSIISCAKRASNLTPAFGTTTQEGWTVRHDVKQSGGIPQ